MNQTTYQARMGKERRVQSLAPRKKKRPIVVVVTPAASRAEEGPFLKNRNTNVTARSERSAQKRKRRTDEQLKTRTIVEKMLQSERQGKKKKSVRGAGQKHRREWAGRKDLRPKRAGVKGETEIETGMKKEAKKNGKTKQKHQNLGNSPAV